MSARVRCYFDFVSPYTWLALEAMPEFAARHDVDFELRPVLYAALLDATGLGGPVETSAKRAYTFADVRRCAQYRGLVMQGPPAHPFRSLAALRVACAFDGHVQQLPLCVRLARAAWSAGSDLEDLRVIETLVGQLGLPTADLAALVQDAAIKGRLRQYTGEARASPAASAIRGPDCRRSWTVRAGRSGAAPREPAAELAAGGDQRAPGGCRRATSASSSPRLPTSSASNASC